MSVFISVHLPESVQAIVDRICAGDAQELPLVLRPQKLHYLSTPELLPLSERAPGAVELVEEIQALGQHAQSHHHIVVMALLLYGAGAMDEAHNLVLPLSWSAPTPFGGAAIRGSPAKQGATYVHAMLHRHEGELVGQEGGGMVGWDNASFWFSQVGRHPLYARLRQEATVFAEGSPALQQHLKGHRNSWDPGRFLDLCRATVASGDADALQFCNQMLSVEWLLLLEDSCRLAQL